MEVEPDPGVLSVTSLGPENQRQGILSCPTPWCGYQHPCQIINDRDRPQTQRATCPGPPSDSLEPLDANTREKREQIRKINCRVVSRPGWSVFHSKFLCLEARESQALTAVLLFLIC